MKKFSVLLTLLLVMVSSSVFAGSIDYLSNQSAKFLMTFTRNASTDASADIANYNPAGTAFLAEGLYIDVSNQTLIKPYATKSNIYASLSYAPLAGLGVSSEIPSEFEQSTPTYLLPNVYMVYNFGQAGTGKLAVYCHVGIAAGGGSLSWDDGTAPLFATLTGIFKGVSFYTDGSAAGDFGIINHQRFDASSVYYTAHIGASYALIDNMFSLSLGAKALKAERSLGIYGDGWTVNAGSSKAEVYIDGSYSFDATGYTPVIGVDVKPVEELTLSARYEHEAKMRFEYDENLMNPSSTIVESISRGVLTKVGIFDGKAFDYDMPAILALGAEFKVMPELAVMTSANIYFLSRTSMGKAYDSGDTAYEDAAEVDDYFGTGYEVSLGATYLIIPELKVGLGYIYTESGAKEKYFDDSRTWLNCAGNPPLDSWTIGTGLTYTVIENMDLTLAGSWTHYLPEHYNIKNPQGIQAGQYGEYTKDVYNIGIGAGYKI